MCIWADAQAGVAARAAARTSAECFMPRVRHSDAGGFTWELPNHCHTRQLFEGFLKIFRQRSATLTKMAPPVSAAKPASLTVAPPQWGEREVRRMLRGLRRPHRLETEPLARFLCHAYGIERPYDACVRLIGDALLDKGLVGKRLYELIQVCDLDANDTLVGTASAMGISPRQFFRY